MSLSFDALRRHYPTGTQSELFKALGGEWPSLIGKPNYENTCAVRMSVAHFRAGTDIPRKYREAMDGRGNTIVLKVPTFRNFVAAEYGESDWGMSKPVGGDLTKDDLPQKTGILAYHFKEQHVNGHFDLWTGKSFVGTGNFSDISAGFTVFGEAVSD